jgi:S1-C subfamily serine protease
MNTLIYSPSGSSAGVGFAVPASTIKRMVRQIIKFGRVIQPGFGFASYPDHILRKYAGKKGVIIREVIKGSEADKAAFLGTRVTEQRQIILGDIIVEVDEIKITGLDDLYSVVENKAIGSSVKVKVIRVRQILTITITTKLMDIGK